MQRFRFLTYCQLSCKVRSHLAQAHLALHCAEMTLYIHTYMPPLLRHSKGSFQVWKIAFNIEGM